MVVRIINNFFAFCMSSFCLMRDLRILVEHSPANEPRGVLNGGVRARNRPPEAAAGITTNNSVSSGAIPGPQTPHGSSGKQPTSISVCSSQM